MQKVDPSELGSESGAVEPPASADASSIPPKVLDKLLSIDGVKGVGQAGPGRLVAYLETRSGLSNLPDRIEGFAVEARHTGTVRLQG